jgi:hypothetical protein
VLRGIFPSSGRPAPVHIEGRLHLPWCHCLP